MDVGVSETTLRVTLGKGRESIARSPGGILEQSLKTGDSSSCSKSSDNENTEN